MRMKKKIERERENETQSLEQWTIETRVWNVHCIYIGRAAHFNALASIKKKTTIITVRVISDRKCFFIFIF